MRKIRFATIPKWSTMTKPPERLETTRLVLRLPILDDASVIFQKYAQDTIVTKYLIWRPHENVDITKEFIRRCIACWSDGNTSPWVIVRKSDGELVGMIELRIDRHSADIGYVISREYWGIGYATEITKSVIDWAMLQGNIYRVWATCDTENLASARVLEKAGMQREGILRRFIVHPNITDKPRDSYCYSVVK